VKRTPPQFLSDQEFFDAAWNWLVVENHPKCDCPMGDSLYRDGDKTCVIGAFIPEELYDLNFADDPIIILLERYSQFRDWFRHLRPELMKEVEEVHNAFDSSRPTREATMRSIAATYGLRCPVQSGNRFTPCSWQIGCRNFESQPSVIENLSLPRSHYRPS